MLKIVEYAFPTQNVSHHVFFHQGSCGLAPPFEKALITCLAPPFEKALITSASLQRGISMIE
jgi:hypothetical protein